MKVVPARELSARLGSDRDFPTWFKYQMESLNLIEGKDYSDYSPSKGVNSEIKRKRGSPTKDFDYPESREISQIT